MEKLFLYRPNWVRSLNSTIVRRNWGTRGIIEARSFSLHLAILWNLEAFDPNQLKVFRVKFIQESSKRFEGPTTGLCRRSYATASSYFI